MSDNKTTLTVAEIKKALEIIEQLCRGCKVEKTICCPGCISTLISQSLDIINRLEAEREALISGQETLQKALSDKIAEIERLQKLLEGWKTEAYKVADEKDKLYCEAVERVKATKAEAIKEFTEKLCKGRVSNDPVVIAVKVELKEMAGESK